MAETIEAFVTFTDKNNIPRQHYKTRTTADRIVKRICQIILEDYKLVAEVRFRTSPYRAIFWIGDARDWRDSRKKKIALIRELEEYAKGEMDDQMWIQKQTSWEII